MKKRIPILILLLMLPAFLCFGWSMQDAHKAVIARQTVASGGCSRGTILVNEDWEDFADGAEWSTDAGSVDWTETGASTNVFIADNDDTISPHGGLICGMVDVGNSGNQITTLISTAAPYLTVDFWFSNTVDTSQALPMTCEGICSFTSTRLMELQMDSDNNFELRQDGVFAVVVASVSAGWHHVEIQHYLDDNDGDDCLAIWFDGVDKGTWDTRNNSSPDNINRYCGGIDWSTNDVWYDDLLIYEGERCAE